MVDSIADAMLKNFRDGGNGGTPQSVNVNSFGSGVQVVPSALGGTTITASKVLTAATNNALNLKGSAGRVYSCMLQNTTASWKFLKLYNKATLPVPGTDTPVYSFGIPPNGCLDLDQVYPLNFSTGIGYAITGASPDLDNTATAVGDVLGVIGYI